MAPPIVHEVLQSPGQPLDAQTRRSMETSFGTHLADSKTGVVSNAARTGQLLIDSPESPCEREADQAAEMVLNRAQSPSSGFRQDFSGIRVHADARAGEAARSVNAQAFTVGQNLVFGAGRYAPGISEGRRLLAHELTHSLQQHSGQQLRRKLSVDPNLAPDAPPTDPSAGLTSATRFSMMDSLIQKLCPKFHVNSSGDVESVSLQSFSPDSLAKGSHGTGCCCLNILQEASTQWTIEVSSVIGAQTNSASHKVFLNPTNTPLEFGAFTASNKLGLQGAVPDAGHELCGHAALGEINAHPQGSPHSVLRLTQDIHDPTVRLENKISEEQGVPASELRGLARSGSHRGESVDKITIKNFPFNDMAIPTSEKSKIKFAAQYIFTPPPADENEFVGIRGHSDKVGSPTAKKAVSEGRAKNVEAALKHEGVPSTIQVLGLPSMPRFNPVEGVGDSQLPTPPLDADQANWRRVEIFMSSMPAGAQVIPAGTPTGVTAHTQNPNVPALKGSSDPCIKKLVTTAYP